MSKLFIDLMCGFREFAEVTGKEKELFPAIIKAVGNCEGKDECKCLDDNVYVINVENASRATDNLIDAFYGSDRESKKTKENAVFDCHSCGSDRIEYSDYLFAYSHMKNIMRVYEKIKSIPNGKFIKKQLNDEKNHLK